MGAPTHRMSHTREWRSLHSALKRCHYPGSKDYPNYGGSDIKVCDRWRNDHSLFFSDMGPRPQGQTLDRIDVNGDYSLENCRWATPRKQARGRRDVVLLTVRGTEKLMAEWSDKSGVTTERINARLKMGWPAWDAVNRGMQKPGPPKAGETGRVQRLWKGTRMIDDHPAVRRRG